MIQSPWQNDNNKKEKKKESESIQIGVEKAQTSVGKGGDSGILQKQLWTEDQSFRMVNSYSGSIVNLPGPKALG